MSSIKHHLNDVLLMGYSAGTLPEAFNVVVATHVSLCDECRARLEAFDALGGTLIDDVDEAPMSEGSFASCMTRIANADRAPAPTAPVTDLPAPLAAYLGGGLETVNWRRIGGGVSQAILKTSKSATVRILRIPGGVAMPDHGHRGTELTLVLRGAFRDEQDRFGPGDILQHPHVADARRRLRVWRLRWRHGRRLSGGPAPGARCKCHRPGR